MMQPYKYLVVATRKEASLPAARAAKRAGYKCVVVGVGGTNIIKALRDVPRWATVINVGYAGSASLPVGTEVKVSRCRLWHPAVDFREEEYQLQDGDGTLCLTAGDFVTDGSRLPEGAVVDMELAYIAAFDFVETIAVKYISDNLNYEQYERQQSKSTNLG